MLRRPIRLRQARTRFSTGLPPQFLAEKSPTAVQSGAPVPTAQPAVAGASV